MKSRTVKLLYPRMHIKRPATPIVFLDTFVWHSILSEYRKERDALDAACHAGKITVAITSAIEGELKGHGILDEARALCGDSLISVPIGRIPANQMIHSLLCFIHKRIHFSLSWDLAISEVPVLRPPIRLKDAATNLVFELKLARKNYRGPRKELVAVFVDIERGNWKTTLTPYCDALIEEQQGIDVRSLYDEFFLTDYFTDLPYIMLGSYFLAYLFRERELSVQDLVDVFSLSELLPYTSLYVFDKDQHTRMRRLQRDYGPLFKRVDDACFISSTLLGSTNPKEALRSLLRSLQKE